MDPDFNGICPLYSRGPVSGQAGATIGTYGSITLIGSRAGDDEVKWKALVKGSSVGAGQHCIRRRLRLAIETRKRSLSGPQELGSTCIN